MLHTNKLAEQHYLAAVERGRRRNNSVAAAASSSHSAAGGGSASVGEPTASGSGTTPSSTNMVNKTSFAGVGGRRTNVPLIQDGYGSDEDLPESLKPVKQPPPGGLAPPSSPGPHKASIGGASASDRTKLSPQRKRNSRFTAWLSGLLPWNRGTKDDEYMYISVVRQKPCRPTFIFDPSGRFCYYWSMVVSVAFLYNLWVISYRFSFNEITEATKVHWFLMDYSADCIYVLDLIMGFRTAYFKDGVLVTSTRMIKDRFMNSSHFYLSCLSLLPLDFLYLSLGYRSAVRCIRLVKIYRFWQYLERAERHSNSPNAFRCSILMHYLMLAFHWNACILYASREWFVMTDGRRWDTNDTAYNYLNAYTVSCSALLLLQTEHLLTPMPKWKMPLLIMTVERIAGLLVLAGVIGYVANVVNHLSMSRKQFQANIDGVKTYMRMRGVPSYLQMKVIRWFDYLWQSNRFGEDQDVLRCLPDRLRAEVSIQVHLNTLKRVEIFRNTEPGFLCELVLRLSPFLFSPGDYVCRKGEVGKEMYVVNSGKLKVINDECGTVVATLTAGTYFGEISLLNLGNEGNRRTASVLSVGYSELLRLTKKDIWDVLEDYPTARERLEEIAHRRIQEVRAQAKKRATELELQRRKEDFERMRQRRSSAPPGAVLDPEGLLCDDGSQPINVRHRSYDAGTTDRSGAQRRRGVSSSSRLTTVSDVGQPAGMRSVSTCVPASTAASSYRREASTSLVEPIIVEEEPPTDQSQDDQPSTDVSPLSPLTPRID